MNLVLDAWAVLAWLRGESAGEAVRDLVAWAEGDTEAGERIRGRFADIDGEPTLSINLINLGEVFYILGRRYGEREADETLAALSQAPIEVTPASRRIVWGAARLKMTHPLSYADAIAASTAQSKDAGLVTGDPELQRLPDVSILWLGDV